MGYLRKKNKEKNLYFERSFIFIESKKWKKKSEQLFRLGREQMYTAYKSNVSLVFSSLC